MKRFITICTVIAAFVAAQAPTVVNAAHTETFEPSDIDLQDLPHAYNYTWGIDFDVPEGEVIVEAVITFHNIYDWTYEYGDHLYIHLLDNPSEGVVAVEDLDGSSWGGSDDFSGQGILVGDWSDPWGGWPRGFDLTYTFSDSDTLLNGLNAYAQTSYGPGSANFGFAIDPDCHYYNEKVSFTLTFVPAPGAVLLGGIGVGLVGWLRGRKML